MFNKINNHIQILNNICHDFSYNLINFGFKVSFLNFLINFPNLTENFYSKILNKQQIYIYDFLVKRYSTIIDFYKNAEMKVGINNKKIWCMWWNGIENAPELVKICIDSIEKYSGDYELIIITKNNYLDYVEIPIEIINKVENNIISIVHFSEIIRARLLSLYGGVWVDATVFICDYIFNEFDDNTFNTVFLEEKNLIEYISRGKWCIFFMGGKQNILFSFLYDMLVAYYLDYDKNINYFLGDYIIEIAYNSFSECKEFIDDSSLNNSKIFYLEENFSKRCSNMEFLALCNKYKFFKLSYKKNYKKFDEDNNITYYGQFLRKNK